jgi:hypothetical protein
MVAPSLAKRQDRRIHRMLPARSGRTCADPSGAYIEIAAKDETSRRTPPLRPPHAIPLAVGARAIPAGPAELWNSARVLSTSPRGERSAQGRVSGDAAQDRASPSPAWGALGQTCPFFRWFFASAAVVDRSGRPPGRETSGTPRPVTRARARAAHSFHEIFYFFLN